MHALLAKCTNKPAADALPGVAHFTEEQGFKDMYPHQVTIAAAACGVCSMNAAGNASSAPCVCLIIAMPEQQCASPRNARF